MLDQITEKVVFDIFSSSGPSMTYTNIKYRFGELSIFDIPNVRTRR